VQAIVYVVDAADLDALDAAARELAALCARPSLQGIPLLVLGNKNDLPGALGTAQLIGRMGLEVRGMGVWVILSALRSNRQRSTVVLLARSHKNTPKKQNTEHHGPRGVRVQHLVQEPDQHRPDAQVVGGARKILESFGWFGDGSRARAPSAAASARHEERARGAVLLFTHTHRPITHARNRRPLL
jgi:hypothetical protein